MKRFCTTLLLLVFALFLASCSAPPADFVALPLAERDGTADEYTAAEGILVALSVNAPLSGLEFSCKTDREGAKITVKIYEANTDYDTTLSADPVREETFQSLAPKMLWQFNSLPAGDYFIAFSDSEGTQLLRSAAPSREAGGKILHYRNGAVMTEGTLALTLLCEKTEEVTQPALITFTYPIIVE